MKSNVVYFSAWDSPGIDLGTKVPVQVVNIGCGPTKHR